MKKDIFISIIMWIWGIINLLESDSHLRFIGLLFIITGFMYMPLWSTTKDNFYKDDEERIKEEGYTWSVDYWFKKPTPTKDN